MGKTVGIVKFFDAKKGYGFIVGTDGNKYFFRSVDILKKYKACRSNEKVIFDLAKDHRGLKAINVRSLKGE
jgi:cold shock CspA family protein